MSRKHIFAIGMTVSCVLLFLQRFTGMAVHAILGLALLVGSIWHTARRRRAWKSYNGYAKTVGILLWCSLAGVMFTGFLLKPMKGVFGVILAHKISAIMFVVFMVLHMKVHNRKKITKHLSGRQTIEQMTEQMKEQTE